MSETLAQLGAADLAVGGQRELLRPQRYGQRRGQAQPVGQHRGDRARRLRRVGAGARHEPDRQHLAAALGLRHPDRGHPVRSYAGRGARHLLDLVAGVVFSVKDDEFLGPPDDGQPVAVQLRQIAGVEPAVTDERGIGLGVVHITRCQPLRADVQPPGLPFRKWLAGRVDNPQFGPGRRGTDRDVLPPVDPAQRRRVVQPPECDAGAGLGHAPGRLDHPQPGAEAGGSADEIENHRIEDLLSAAQQAGEPAQVVATRLGGAGAQRLGHQPVAEGRRPTVGGPVPVKRVDPPDRLGEDPVGGYVPVGGTGEQRHEVIQQQRTTVVYRHPVECGVPGRDPHLHPSGDPQLHQATMGQRDHLGAAGAA